VAASNLPTDAAGLLVAGTGTWNLDPSATSVRLRTKAMWGLAKVNISFKATGGSATVAAGGAVSGLLVIDSASVYSGNKKRDTHLRTADFLEVDRYPEITFSATSATPADGGTFTLSGTLTVRGTANPFEILASVTEATPTSFVVTVETDLDRSKWGLTWAKMGARLDNQLSIRARFTKAG
jgi:polyisoprenoid-binding protein YceI